MAVAQPTHLLIFNETSGANITNYGTVSTVYAIQQGSATTHYEWVQQAQTPTGGYIDLKQKGGANMPWMATAATAFANTLTTLNFAIGFTVDSLEGIVGNNFVSHPDANEGDVFVNVVGPSAGGDFDITMALNSNNGSSSGPTHTFTGLTFGTFYRIAASLDVSSPATATGRFKLGSNATVTPATTNMTSQNMGTSHPWFNRARDFTNYGGHDGRFYYIAYQRGGTPWSSTDLGDINTDPSAAITGWPGAASNFTLAVDSGSGVGAGQNISLPVSMTIDSGGGVGEGQNVGLLADEAYVASVVHGQGVGEGQEIPFILVNTGTHGEGVGQGQDISLLAQALLSVDHGQGVGAGQDITLTAVDAYSLTVEHAQGVGESGNLGMRWSEYAGGRQWPQRCFGLRRSGLR